MKKAITEQDIREQSQGDIFVATRDMVLTPAAREYASRQGIAIKYGDQQPRQAAAPMGEDQLAKIIEEIVLDEIKTRAGTAPAAEAPRPVPQQAAQDPVLGKVLDASGRDAVLNCSSDEDANRAIVTVVGQNRPGVVARISAVVAECGGDLADMSQVILDQYFSMIFIVDLAGIDSQGVSFRLFKEKLQDEAVRLGGVQVLVMHEGVFKAMHKV